VKHSETVGNAIPARQKGVWQKVFDGRNRQVRGLSQRGSSCNAPIQVFAPEKGEPVPKSLRLERATTVPQAIKALAERKFNRSCRTCP